MIPLPVMAASACLPCSNIAKLWEMAGRPHDANPAGPLGVHDVTQGRRIWDEMPQSPGELRDGWGASAGFFIASLLLLAGMWHGQEFTAGSVHKHCQSVELPQHSPALMQVPPNFDGQEAWTVSALNRQVCAGLDRWHPQL